ncbi:MAG: hypothetical protein Harvfovirus59_9 [Harvfovirus sp.]|uniref:Uncharacterized protein n=1 Tax=Harvfovirus sp. TaxID=2487768 RepID=A0A3G5A5I0_9VIRU|nr:MAG: hypothetical protein Harvfovirus59_9 [Harvfovirus sp.]
MSKLELAGFKIHELDHKDIYIFPIYSYNCSCNFLHYVYRKHTFKNDTSYEEKLFHPKYFNKFLQLQKEKKSLSELEKLIPHVTITMSTVQCKYCSITKKKSAINRYELISYYMRPSLDNKIRKKFLTSLNHADYLEIDRHLDRVIIEYWALCIYSWGIGHDKKIYSSFEEMKIRIDEAFETKLLTELKPNRKRFEKAIESVLKKMIIPPLIDIICNYADSPVDSFRKIISILHQDILKYGKIMSDGPKY